METKLKQKTVNSMNFGDLPPEGDFDRNNHVLSGRLDLIKDVNVQLETRLGGCELSIAKLSQLKDGDVLTLDKKPDDLIEIILGGTVVARGRLVVAGECFGVRIEQITELSI